MPPYTKIIVAIRVCLGFLLLSLFTGCTSFPVPKEKGDSLFILYVDRSYYTGSELSRELYFKGPTQFVIEIKDGKQELHFKKVKPGIYKTLKQVVRWQDGHEETWSGPVQTAFKIDPDTMYLFPYKIVTSWNPAVNAEPMDDKDRLKISKELPDYLGFADWFGKSYKGFGLYTPRFSLEKKKYEVRIKSKPPGALVIVDQQKWGNTPITVLLTGGKHQISIKKKSFFEYRKNISINSDKEINTVLSVIKESEGSMKKITTSNQFSVLVMPFKNIGNKEGDYLEPVFADVLQVTMSQDKHLSVEKAAFNDKSKTESLRPYFHLADERGFDLMVVGEYKAQESDMFVHAVLYDVKEERVKTGMVYSGKAGLSMFDSIDAMADKFLTAVRRVLPAEGKRIVVEEHKIDNSIVSMEKKVTRKEITQKRRERKNDISVCYNVGTHLDTKEGMDFINFIARNLPFSIQLDYDRLLSDNFDFKLRIAPAVTAYKLDKSYYFNELPIYAGIQYVFTGYKVDLYSSFLGVGRITNKWIPWLKADDPVIAYGPFYYAGIVFDSGIKYYTYKRISEKPAYFNAGMVLNLIQYRFENRFKDITPFTGGSFIYFGYGSRF